MDIRLQENLKNVQHNYIAPFLWLHGEVAEVSDIIKKKSELLQKMNYIYERDIINDTRKN